MAEAVRGGLGRGGLPQGCPPKLALVAGEAADFLPSSQGGAAAAKDTLLGLQDPPFWVLQAGPGWGRCSLGTVTQTPALSPSLGRMGRGAPCGESHTRQPIPQSLRSYLSLLGQKWGVQMKCAGCPHPCKMFRVG